ncbi:bifunctional folylpolyglutamate synthase/dihydrofolate synthase, partial [Leptolyngbya sp. FACHB-36]|uniref:bifunctional folylpolyglutamate synthase/dihydrofolate synthase n=1 Tax=Leptolyngbya sp. FACHB-36 TaxID=2692808 RepID=UPI0019C33444|nr:bifunctional folylpolyglutamate synthase/dihydrofolate synthase [Leptolyngbya sp. FACHB-36]
MDIDATLQTFEHFGVKLGLESIQQLLAALGNPEHQVPIVHVAGSNGKGSVCAYVSAVLTHAGYRVGRYTSPHLVDWCERICINEQPITPADLARSLQQVMDVIDANCPPTQFEVITAAAWLYFAQEQVDIAVIEVGLGGRLDATNVCDYPLVSVITSLSREHWQRLGPTLADIAREKAGILKPHCPAVIGQLPPEAAAVVHRRLTELSCSTTYPLPARDLGNGWAEYRGIEEETVILESEDASEPPEHGVVQIEKIIRYRLPLQGAIQLHNSALAIAT